MDGDKVRDWETRCIEEQPPACSAACPVHVDARAMIAALGSGDFAKAFDTFASRIPFPNIISRICGHPCESVCRRAEAGAAIRIGALERAAVEYGGTPRTLRVQRAQAKRRIAIVGAGLSGLTAALELHCKGHAVTVYDAAARPLERLRHYPPAVLDAADIAADLERLLASAIEWKLETRVTPDDGPNGLLRLAQDFDAVYFGPGPDAQSAFAPLLQLTAAARIDIDALTFATSHPKIFAGGAQRQDGGYSPILSLHDGHYAALSIERLLQGASLSAKRERQGPFVSPLYVDTSRFAALPAIVPAADGYGKDAAMAEAARCLPCHCLECVRVCPYLEHYGAYPKRYVREIYNNDSIVMGQHKSNRMLDSCLLCGLCAEVCPNDVSMADICLDARRSLTAKGKMPPSHHEFALRDMAFSQSDAFALARHQPGHAHSSAVFFPGCQLAASSPDQVEHVYSHLCGAVDGGVGLMLGCCGAPADWAGRRDLFDANLQQLLAHWDELGQPLIIAACSTCLRTLRDARPDIPSESLWTTLERIGIPTSTRPALPPRTLAIHDPCTTRHDEAVRASVRRIAETIGIRIEELNAPGLGSCCGFGGLASFVNPDITDAVIDRRTGQSPADYLTYCAMCRDNFARRGKRSLHLLDLLFVSQPDAAARADPGFSRRQENRAQLKTRLMRTLWGDSVNDAGSCPELELSEAVRAELERKQILEDDIRQVLLHVAAGGGRLLDPGSGHFIASHRPAAITYWVEYAEHDGRFVVYRAYSHRMQLG
ncbi:pyridine nucleotide-disulfide oxidoreductase/dicluster-binding protein [Paludibacterium yongneupense]|uniref:pyridine nucleotide-disulfide oxidoreductase/dicluster-binding protein n=1 Tax=Paludibacterium yongneupense TaxID=400061 RepID=UPI000424DD55|nr:pyridine nucleotide-disulfide oxidoreductase/dicluster-binding protein [Paludibacterium yongneupense]